MKLKAEGDPRNKGERWNRLGRLSHSLEKDVIREQEITKEIQGTLPPSAHIHLHERPKTKIFFK